MGIGVELVRDFQAAQGFVKEVDFPRMSFQPHLARGIPPDDNSDEFRELYSIQATIYRCVFVRGSNLARLPKKVVKVIDEETTEDGSQNPLFDVLLKNPNPFQTIYQFWESTLGYLDLQGEAPWALIKNRAGNKLLAIIPLRPDKIKVIPDPENLIAGYVFENQNTRFAIPADEMVFLKYFNPSSDFRGLSPLKAAMLDVELDLRAISANKSMLATGGLPSGVLSLGDNEMDDDQWDTFKRKFRAEYEGSTKRGSIMMLDTAVTWEQIQLSLQELEYMKGRAFTQDIVRMVYGVPPIMIGDFEQATIKASSFTQERTFWSETMTPLTRMLSETITKEVLPLLSPDPNLKFIYDLSEIPALQADRSVQSKIVKDGIATAQVTPNEGRSLIFGLDPVSDPAMDQHYIAGNLIPIASASEPQEESAVVETVKILDGVVKMLEDKTPVEQVNREMVAIQQGLDERKADETLFKVWKSLERIRERSITAFDRLMNKLFDEQRRSVLNNLRKQVAFWSGKQVTVDTVFDYDEWVMRFEEEGQPLIARALTEAAEDLADNVGGSYDISGDPKAATFVNFESRQYAVNVNSTTQGKIDTLLRGAVSNGLSIAETAVLINKYYESNAPFRAERIARTEMVTSTNAGRVFSMQQNGFESHMWVTQRDTRVRDEHISLDGEVVRIGKSFSNGASYPQSPNERCFTIPSRGPSL